MGSVQDVPSMPVGSYPSTGIDVIVVGTGLAGLTASIECIRKGHNVTVLERDESINTAGDMYFMGQSATQFFKHWPELAEEYKQISMHNAWIETYKHSGEHMIPPTKVSDRLRMAGMDPNQPPGSFQIRPLVYGIFVRQLERLGVKVKFGKRIVDYYEDADRGKGGVITDQGEKFEADVVIAADGIGSKAQKLVGGQVRAVSSGRAMWRAAFPLDALDKDPEVKAFYKCWGEKENEPMVKTYLGPGSYGLVLNRPDRCIWLINHESTASSEENWNNKVDASEVLAEMDKGVGEEPWAPIFKKLVAITPPDTIVNFELKWRNPQPSWLSPHARVVQIGDSAHSFLPASGNGATQAMEDGVSIATCLQLAGSKENVPLAVRTHVRFRFVRCSCAQKLGFANAELLQATNWEQVKKNPKLAQPQYPRWAWKHDPEKYTYENYESMSRTIRDGIPLEKVTADDVPPNYPPGYTYKPWSIDEMMDDVKSGRQIDLGGGDWS